MAYPKNPYFLLLFSFFISINTHLSEANNSISTNHSLSGNQFLTSDGGIFVLGFFQPGNKSSSHNFYIGIWYGKISQLTPVWVANRETPISDPTSSELRISDDGNLVLLNQFRTQIWSTNATPMTSNTTVAVILDSGNLVLRDGSDPSKVFWQSFDHPTDAVLPGVKFGMNKVTGEYQKLISWRNSGDPAPGIFSNSIAPNGSDQFFLLWNKTKIYWTTGLWNGQIFSNTPELTGPATATNYMYKFAYISNATTSYFTFSLQNNMTFSRLVVDLSGHLKILTWVEAAQQWVQFWSEPKHQCAVYARCGPFSSCRETSCDCLKGFRFASPKDWDLGDESRGCVRNTPLQCGDKDKFLAISIVSSPDQSRSLQAGSVKDCELACLNNCSCTAYSYSSGCSVWYNGLLNLQQSSDGSSSNTLFLRLAASELPKSKAKKVFVEMSAAVAVGVFIAFLVLVVLLLICRCRRRRRMISLSNAVEVGLVPFRYRDLQSMTNNFAEKIGGGGFGSVFKGALPHSTPIAVKKLEGGFHHQGEKQFRSEVSIIGAIQHVNLVRLRGFCSEGSERLLVYDYMPNGSLDKQLFQPSSMVLSWRTRYQIALGTARGLAYLHEKCRDCIIHCDIKPENILLDDSFVPKVADFGLAKLVGRDVSRVLTTMRGTIGYLAPEWIYGTAITTKVDVYSYGMMLLEIISGRRNSKQTEEGSVGFFPTLAGRKIVEGDVVSLLDPRLEGDADLEELDRTCKLAFWCIQDNENHRPSMGQIVQILEGVQTVSLPPIPRSLRVLAKNPEDMGFFSDSQE